MQFSSEAGRPRSYSIASHSTQTCRHSDPSPITAPYQNRTNSTKAGHEGAARGTTRVPKEQSQRQPRPAPCRLICLDTPPAPTNTRTEQTFKLHTPASADVMARGHDKHQAAQGAPGAYSDPAGSNTACTFMTRSLPGDRACMASCTRRGLHAAPAMHARTERAQALGSAGACPGAAAA